VVEVHERTKEVFDAMLHHTPFTAEARSASNNGWLLNRARSTVSPTPQHHKSAGQREAL
jgi:hypothetical protein